MIHDAQQIGTFAAESASSEAIELLRKLFSCNLLINDVDSFSSIKVGIFASFGRSRPMLGTGSVAPDDVYELRYQFWS